MRVASQPNADRVDAIQPMANPAILVTTPEAIAELVQTAVVKALAEHDDLNSRFGDRMAFPEKEAAEKKLGMAPHVLRDCRLRGEIGFSVGPGRRIFYTVDDLKKFLARNRSEARL